VAILAPVFPTITLELCKRLHYDLRRLVRKKNQFHLEIKLKVTRYIGELVKFRVFPKSDVFNCLRILVASFVHHQIEMACALVETCGKFLYLNYDSHQRMKLYLVNCSNLKLQIYSKNRLAFNMFFLISHRMPL